MERSMLGVKKKDRIQATEIRKKTLLTDLVVAAKKLKWNWAGHISRLEGDRWTKVCTEWCPANRKRKKGRQFRRWRDEITQVTGSNYAKIARCREDWNKMGEAFAQKWA
ncbi:uncharacterized protein [Rhodnius prolixus]